MSYELVKAAMQRDADGDQQKVRLTTRAGKEFFGPIVGLTEGHSSSAQSFIEMHDYLVGVHRVYPVFIACDDISSIQLPSMPVNS